MVLNIVASPTASDDVDISCLTAFVAAVKDMPNKIVGISRKIKQKIDRNNSNLGAQLYKSKNEVNPKIETNKITPKKSLKSIFNSEKL